MRESTAWSWISRSSSAALLAGAVGAPDALAGACCTGSTTTIPTRLGACETALGGLGVSGNASVGRWDTAGLPVGSSLAEQSVVTTLAAGWRWDRKGQLGVSAPVWVNHKAVDGGASAWGGGPGDVRVTAAWDPVEETSAAVPVFSAGARLPTGRSADHAEGALFEDVTGLGPAAVLVGVVGERTLGDWPWWVGLDAELGLAATGVSPLLTAHAGLGRYLGRSFSLSGAIRHARAWSPDPSARTVVGARLVHGRLMRWRGWAGVEADVPVAWLGQSAMRQVSAGGGVALVR